MCPHISSSQPFFLEILYATGYFLAKLVRLLIPEANSLHFSKE
jgi:hypothetical protein